MNMILGGAGWIIIIADIIILYYLAAYTNERKRLRNWFNKDDFKQ
ncbi:MAG: hypothetical protein ACLQQ4_15870 [Bacteroidia bacterium]